MAGLLEEAVTVGINEYKKLVADSTKLQVIKDLLEKEQYLSIRTLYNIVGIEKEIKE